MATYRVTLNASVPEHILADVNDGSELQARSRVLAQSWYERREIDWRVHLEQIDRSGQSLTLHTVRLELDIARTPHPQSANLCLALDIVVRGNDQPADKALRILDLPGARPQCGRRRLSTSQIECGSIAVLRGNSVIGPVPAGWPLDRMLTGYSHNLGSYGQGGVGLSGWQLNGGSWIVLPLKHSDGFIWLTREVLTPARDFFSLEAKIDQRIIGAHPNQILDFPPWDHRYAGHPKICDLPDFAVLRPTVMHFEATPSGFVLEAANGIDRWRFAMGDHLPRPAWAGTGNPRDLFDGEAIGDTFALAHDCYLEV